MPISFLERYRRRFPNLKIKKPNNVRHAHVKRQRWFAGQFRTWEHRPQAAASAARRALSRLAEAPLCSPP